jgi:hypothetical protein
MRTFRLAAWAIPLWRSPGVLQLGLDAGCPVIRGAPEATLDALLSLQTPRTNSELRRIAPSLPPDWLDSLLSQLVASGALETDAVQPPGRVLIAGSGALAVEVFRLLSSHPVQISWLRATGSKPPPGARIRFLEEWEAALERPDLTLLIPSTIEHDRALSDMLVAEGLDHLVVRSEPDRAVVGPFTVGGRFPCSRCLDMHRRDADAAWPYLLAQLALRPARTHRSLRAWAASTAVSHAMCHLAGGIPDSCGRTIELEIPGRLQSRAWRMHQNCRCSQSWSATNPSTASA